MNKLLETLTSEAFAVEVGFLSPPPVLRRRLSRFAAVRRVERAVREGAIADADVRAFVAEMVRPFQPGSLLPGELALAAVAVAVQYCPQDFAEEYLCHLARLKMSELGTAIRVARECLTARFARPKNQLKRVSFPRMARPKQTGFRVFTPRSGDDRWRPVANRVRFVTARV